MTDNTLDKMSKLDAEIARKTYYPQAKKNGYIGRPMMYVDDVMKIIADREKKMLEFVIGEDYAVDNIKGTPIEPSTRNKYEAINSEHEQQRQRAKEWRKK